MSRLVGGQLWIVPRQARGHLTTRGVLIPKVPAHVVAVAQHRWIRSGDAGRPCGGQEVLGCVVLRYRAGAGRRDRVGAGWRGQAYGYDGSSGTDEDFSDPREIRGAPFARSRLVGSFRQPQWIGYAS